MSVPSSFNFNCPVENVGSPDIHECGLTKTVQWSNTGATSNVTTFNLKYNLLDDLKPVYVTLQPTVRKLIQFKFTGISLNGSSSVDLYIKQGISGSTTTIKVISFTGNTSFNELVNFILKPENDLFLTFDVIVNGGSTGQFNIQVVCNTLNVTQRDFCTGWIPKGGLSFSCSTCPTTETYYTENNISLGDSILKRRWYTNDTLTTEVSDGKVVIPKSNFQINSSKQVLQYSGSTNAFEVINGCSTEILDDCNNPEYVMITHTKVDYTSNTPISILENQDVVKSGLKWSTKTVHAYFDDSNVVSSVAINVTGSCEQVVFTISDGKDDSQPGFISIQEIYGASSNNDPVVPVYRLVNTNDAFNVPFSTYTVLGVGTVTVAGKTLAFVTNSGMVTIKISVGQKKTYNSNDTIFTSINVGNVAGGIPKCGIPVNNYLVGVHPYSPFDSLHGGGYTSKVLTNLYSTTPISGWTTNTFVYTDPLLRQPALPYYYSYSGNSKVYKIGSTEIRRDFGIKTDYKAKKQLFGPTKISKLIQGPKLFQENVGNDYFTLACIEPYFLGSGLVKVIKTYDELDDKIPSLYSYYLGYTNSSEYLANNNFFTSYDFNSFF